MIFSDHFSNISPYSKAQEMEVIGLAATSLLSKYRKIATFDEFLDRLFFLGKAAVAAMLFFVGIPYVASYVILWAGGFF